MPLQRCGGGVLTIGTLPPLGEIISERIIPLIGKSMTLAKSVSEIAKNSNDEYERLSVGDAIGPNERLILIVAIGDNLFVLDCGGMTSQDISNWSTWGYEHEVLSAGETDQGVGAKCGMRNIAGKRAYLVSVKNGMISKAGFTGNEEGVLKECADWFEDDAGLIANRPIHDAMENLAAELYEIGFDVEEEWRMGTMDDEGIDDARDYLWEVIAKRQGWTLAVMEGIGNSIPLGDSAANARRRTDVLLNLKEELARESQLRRTLAESTVLFLDGYRAHQLWEYVPDSMEGIDDVKIEIPTPLRDPDTDAEFVTDGPVTLVLKASKPALQGSRLESLRGVRVYDGRNSVWNEPIPGGTEPGAASHIYGHCEVPSEVLRNYAEPARNVPPRISPECRAIQAAIVPHIEEFRQLISESLNQRRRTNRRDDRVQDNIDERMDNIERLIDIEALFEEGDGVGGDTDRAIEITHIFLESHSDPLTSVMMASGVSHRLRVIPRGTVGGRYASLQQLRGVSNISPFFNVESSDDSVVRVLPNLTIEAVGTGVTNISVSSTDDLHGAATTDLEVTVIDIEKEPEIVLEPTPGPRGAPFAARISGSAADGTEIDESNTLFGIGVEGPASVRNRFPPQFVTSRSQEPGGGSVRVQWKQDEVALEAFTTTDELHEPTPRPPGGPDGNNNRKFPKLIVCGQPHGIPMEVQDAVGVTLPDTQNDSPSLPTLYRDVNWDDVGVVWLNQESMESRAALRSHHGGIVGQDTETYARFLDNQTVEVAVRQIMQELVIREVQMMPTTVSGFNQLRNNAIKRLDLLFKSLVDGTLRPVSSDDSEEE